MPGAAAHHAPTKYAIHSTMSLDEHDFSHMIIIIYNIIIITTKKNYIVVLKDKIIIIIIIIICAINIIIFIIIEGINFKNTIICVININISIIVQSIIICGINISLTCLPKVLYFLIFKKQLWFFFDSSNSFLKFINDGDDDDF